MISSSSLLRMLLWEDISIFCGKNHNWSETKKILPTSHPVIYTLDYTKSAKNGFCVSGLPMPQLSI